MHGSVQWLQLRLPIFAAILDINNREESVTGFVCAMLGIYISTQPRLPTRGMILRFIRRSAPEVLNIKGSST